MADQLEKKIYICWIIVKKTILVYPRNPAPPPRRLNGVPLRDHSVSLLQASVKRLFKVSRARVGPFTDPTGCHLGSHIGLGGATISLSGGGGWKTF